MGLVPMVVEDLGAHRLRLGQRPASVLQVLDEVGVAHLCHACAVLGDQVGKRRGPSEAILGPVAIR